MTKKLTYLEKAEEELGIVSTPMPAKEPTEQVLKYIDAQKKGAKILEKRRAEKKQSLETE